MRLEILFAFKNFILELEVEKRLLKQFSLRSRGQFAVRYLKHWNLKIPGFLDVVLNELKLNLPISLKFCIITFNLWIK